MTRYVVGRSVGRSVGRRAVSFFRHLRAVFALLLLPDRLNNLFYHCPCPLVRDFGSRVYGLVLISRALLTFSQQIWQGRQEADNEMPCKRKMSVHQPHAEEVLSFYLREKWGKMMRTNRKGKQTRMKTIKPFLFLQNDMGYD